MIVNGIEVIVHKPDKSQAPKADNVQSTPTTPAAQSTPTSSAAPATPAPDKVQGKNVFTLDPYAVPFKVAYYPYTSRTAYENNKTKFILAKPGDTYKKLCRSARKTCVCTMMSMTNQNPLRMRLSMWR